MSRYIFTKAFSLFILFCVLSFITVGLQSLRGGSASAIAGGQRSSLQEIQKLKVRFGENLSFIEKFAFGLKSCFTFDFGKTVNNEIVLKKILTAFKITFIIASLAALGAFFYGLGFGILSVIYPAIKNSLKNLNYIFLSAPIFIIALLLLWFFSIFISVFPPGGSSMQNWFVLPSMALGLKAGSRLMLFTGSFFENEKNKLYVKTMRVYHFKKYRMYFIFIFKNLMLPFTSFWLLDFASYLAGAAIIETIFAISGLGRLLLKALYQYDFNLITGILTFTALVIFFIGIIQDALENYFKRFSLDV